VNGANSKGNTTHGKNGDLPLRGTGSVLILPDLVISRNILRFRRPRDSIGDYSYIILVFVICHSVSEEARGEPNPNISLNSQVNYESPPPWAVLDGMCGMLGITLCYVDVYFSKIIGRQLDKIIARSSKGNIGLTSSGQLLCDLFTPEWALGTGCLASV